MLRDTTCSGRSTSAMTAKLSAHAATKMAATTARAMLRAAYTSPSTSSSGTKTRMDSGKALCSLAMPAPATK